ncbi:hypothetical protein PsalBI1_04356 (plasmid) [Piscirickettsia salmonis]|nr:hypothetical protein PsalBI1_04356 [Piscirickettsia salmonis]
MSIYKVLAIYQKKKSFRYQERDALKRKAFLEKVAKIDNDKIVYMDEAGMDDTERYAYGHSAKGKRCYAEKPGSRCEPWSAKHGVSRPR